MGVIPAGVNSSVELIPALHKVFHCLRESGLRLSAYKCELGMTKIDHLGSKTTAKGILSGRAEIVKFLEETRTPNTVRQVKRLFGFVQFSQKFIPNRGILPF